MTIEQLEAEVLKLDLRARARLAEKLLHSLEALSDEENECLWAEEALCRHDELQSGSASARPADDVLRDARERLPS
jgi:hypothetical protein